MNLDEIKAALAKVEAERDALREQVEYLRSGLRTFPVGAEHAAMRRIERMLAHTAPSAGEAPAAGADRKMGLSEEQHDEILTELLRDGEAW